MLFQHFPEGWLKDVLSDAESLTERIDAVMSQLLEDFKQGLVEINQRLAWVASILFSLYNLKSCHECIHWILAKKCLSFYRNCVFPNRYKLQFWHLNHQLRCWKRCQAGAAPQWESHWPVLYQEIIETILHIKDWRSFLLLWIMIIRMIIYLVLGLCSVMRLPEIGYTRLSWTLSL